MDLAEVSHHPLANLKSSSSPERPTNAEARFSVRAFKHGRIGRVVLAHGIQKTPLLYPVVCLITGTTPYGGGLWKYILHAHQDGLMRRQLPLMTQILHFLDFSVSPQSVRRWRAKPLRDHFNESSLGLNYQAPIFMDSGGFQLLWNRERNLAPYDIEANPETILKLQYELGADLIATLDYPLPPGLLREEAEERMRKSQENALAALRFLAMPSLQYQPVIYVAAHGQSPDDVCHYVEQIFSDIESFDLAGIQIGVAIGSLVPLRGAQKNLAIAQMVQGAIAGIPEKRRPFTPVHIFGVTGNLVPLLAYLGVDTFDSSTYVQEARSISYIDPITRRPQPILEMNELSCNCRVCRNVNLKELQEALVARPRRGQPLPNGVFKSKYYGDIALHNLEMDFTIVEAVRQATEADALQEYVVQHARRFPRLRSVMDSLGQDDASLAVRWTRTVNRVVPYQVGIDRAKTLSLTYGPDAFDIGLDGYHPPLRNGVLLVIPCSGGKPYSHSRSHRLIAERLAEALGERVAQVHKVTLSGLFGPVPEEFETHHVIMGYDFRLESSDTSQIALIGERLSAYLERHRENYIACFGYATSRAYRTVLEQAAARMPLLMVLPVKPRVRRLTEFFRATNIEELINRIAAALDAPNGSDP